MKRVVLVIIIGIVAITLSSGVQVNVDVARAVIDRIEGDYTMVSFSKGRTHKEIDIPNWDINRELSEGVEIPVTAIEGKFYDKMVHDEYQDTEGVYYQFKSDDNEVLWLLTSDEIGHIPNTNDKYILYYTDNGTAKENSNCDCSPEMDCECYLYDDIFFHVEKVGVQDV